MKKQSFFLTAVLFTSFFASYAQPKPDTVKADLNHSEVYLAKSTIDPPVMAKFHKNFPGVVNEAWATTDNGYLVSYSNDGISYNVFLNKKGNQTSQIRYYKEKDLPLAVHNQIKTLNGCFTIGGVREITTNGATAYLVNINYGKSWKVIRIVSNEMDVFEEH